MLLIQSPLIISGRKNKIMSGLGGERVYKRWNGEGGGRRVQDGEHRG